jgi:hypothetical protein
MGNNADSNIEKRIGQIEGVADKAIRPSCRQFIRRRQAALAPEVQKGAQKDQWRAKGESERVHTLKD